jgi:Cu(I)/Ag(I) efflux system membrane fusion protein
MKLKQWILPTGIGAVMLITGLWIGSSQLGRQSPDDGHDHAAAVEAAPVDAAPTVWTCSMHPQIQQPKPGSCPICGMDLIPLEQDNSADEGPRVLTMSESAKALAEIATTRVIRTSPKVEVRMVGKIAYDETRLKSLSARFPARVERLYVNYTGITVRTGDHLAEIYSPDLLTAQRELLTAVQYDPDGTMVQVAREKLRLWDLLPEQIDGIIQNGSARDRFELRAPLGGIVVHKNINEGDYIKTGDALFRIADLSVLWLPLEAFESDLQWLRYGQKVEFEVESFPGERFDGRIVFIDPVLSDRTRTTGVRVEVPNPNGRLKPGMFARATVFSHVASGGKVIAPELAGKWISPMHPEVIKDGPGACDVCGMDLVPVESLGYATVVEDELPLVVPTSAVLRTGRRAVVYVALPGRDKPTFEGREITIGPRAGDVFLVLDGLQEGDAVVTNGAFKIDSALQILARPSMMNPTGGGPAPGHDHGAGVVPVSQGPGSEHESVSVSLNFTVDEALQILEPYLDLHRALADDQLPEAKAALSKMLEAVGHTSGPADFLHSMLGEDTLSGIRRPFFEILSDALIVAIRENEAAFESSLYLKHCPMVYPDRGADWLQSGEDTLNPYFGTAMQACGETKEIFGSL